MIYHWCYVCDGSVTDRETMRPGYHNVAPLGKVVASFQCKKCGSGGNVFEVEGQVYSDKGAIDEL